jgi:hypothetical protein
MMNVNLEKQDIINMLCGYKPNIQQCQQLEKAGFMKYTGGFVDEWEWKNGALDLMDENMLLHLYMLLARNLDKPISKFEVKLPWNAQKGECRE